MNRTPTRRSLPDATMPHGQAVVESPAVSAPAVLERYAELVQAEMQRLVGTRDLPLYTMLRYHLGWVDPDGRRARSDGGKGLRSTLCLLAAKALSGDIEQALGVAAALDLIHNFSLIHDDIQDGSPRRHHRPTVWRLWGKAQAITAGDALYTLARLAVWELPQRGVPAETVARLGLLLDDACLRLCEGQYLDIEFEDRLDISVDDYLHMIEGKSVALLAASLAAGAIVGGGSETQVEALHQAGRHLGLGFQIRDDILGIWGQSARTGKPTAEDIRSRKKSLPVVLALNRAAGADRELLLKAYAGPRIGAREAAQILQVFAHLDVQHAAQALAEERQQAALDLLAETGIDNEAMLDLRTLVRFSVQREH